MMKNKKLSEQLILIILIIIFAIFILIGILLPRQMLPIYEKNIYDYLRQPLEFVDEEIDDIKNQEIAYLYIYDGKAIISDNFYDIVGDEKVEDILKCINHKYGKFVIRKHTYYYYTDVTNHVTKISVTNDDYIKNAQLDSLYNFFPIILITFLFIAFLLIGWALSIIKKLEYLKQKVDHIDDDTFNHEINDKYNSASEIKTLEKALEDMRLSLKSQEEYRNQMYQNISHDFKTPLTVIKSYTEAIEDEALDTKEGLKVIEEQIDKLEQKVHSLLYLNKLDYIKDLNIKNFDEVDIEGIVKSSIEKFKYRRKDLEFSFSITKSAKFYGTYDFWETIIDNLLNNFLRYAKKEIKITVNKNKIMFYNDGKNIDEDLLDSLFIPFRKGMKGEFGLGLSIVKKTLNYMNYDITVKNNKKEGVTFIISKN